VHRVPGGERKAVFAYRSEIDAWLHQAKNDGNEAVGTLVSDDLPVDHSPVVKPFAPVIASEAPESVAQVDASAPASMSWWQKPIFTLRRASLTIVVVLLAITALSLVLMYKRNYNAQIDKIVFKDNALQALGSDGRVVWTYPFGQSLDEGGEKESERIQLVAAGNSEQKRVLAFAPLLISRKPSPSSDALFSFSMEGKMQWRYNFDETFQFAGSRYKPPWMFGALLVNHDGPDSSVWAAVDSYYWSSCSLVKIDHDGRLLGSFVNWGHFHILNYFQSPHGKFILAGGINNDCNCAVLAVINADRPSGSSPSLSLAADGSTKFLCENCPAGQPYRYILFPRSEIAVATETTYNQVTVILPTKEGVQVGVTETNSGGSLGADWEMYELSTDLMPQSFFLSDHVVDLHRQLEAEHKIKHTVEQCPDFHRSRMIKVWSPENGWRDVPVRPIPSDPSMKAAGRAS
jgi:hypothetical protein